MAIAETHRSGTVVCTKKDEKTVLLFGFFSPSRHSKILETVLMKILHFPLCTLDYFGAS